MKIICQLEIFKKKLKSYVYVFRINQIDYKKKNIDIRNISDKILTQLYVC
jgi:hypothetical protein